MAHRASVFAIAFVVSAFMADEATAILREPSRLDSLEWLVAEGAVVVRGVVVEVAPGEKRDDPLINWRIVTLDVRETLKGDKMQRLKFAVEFVGNDSTLDLARKTKTELLWILKRKGSGVSSDDRRDAVLACHKVNLHARFNFPFDSSISLIPLGSSDPKTGLKPPQILNMDLRRLKTSEELVKAVREAVKENHGPGQVRSHFVRLPWGVAKLAGFDNDCYLRVPVDGRLEDVARRFVQSPADFLPKVACKQDKQDEKNKELEDARQLIEQLERRGRGDDKEELRLEGVRALRLFPSEKNLVFLRSWQDQSTAGQPFKTDANNRNDDLLPLPPRLQDAGRKPALPLNLAQVPEVHFQQPLARSMKTDTAQLHTAVTVDRVHLLNRKQTDGFMKALLSKRSDLAGLPFAMGDACRMKQEDSQNFVWALKYIRRAEEIKAHRDSTEDLMHYYEKIEPVLLGSQEIHPSARIASLMQVLGPESAETRLGLVKYLDGLADANAARALARLAIFSEEAEIRTAATRALKLRRDRDYTDILVAGLNYPWPTVAERSAEAIAQLQRRDLVPNLLDVLEGPDPRAPHTREVSGKKVTVVRELVRINHHHNCLLCHAPATSNRDGTSKEQTDKLAPLTAQVPVPSEAMNAYYAPNSPDILVRFDVTYLRQDFSIKLPVADAAPWPEMQRYDFLVRTREVTEQEAALYQELLQPNKSVMSPYRRAALSALDKLGYVAPDSGRGLRQGRLSLSAGTSNGLMRPQRYRVV